MINLLPKEKQNGRDGIFNPARIGLITGIAIIIFGLGFYAGYLGYENARYEARLDQLNMEMKCYNTSFRKVRNLESMLFSIREKSRVKQAVYADYMAPLRILKTLIDSKPDLIWFERIEFNGTDGSFCITGGATHYKALTVFIGQLEQNKAAFSKLKPEQANIYRNSTGREYVQFKISGILVKRSETGVQIN